MKNNNIVIDYQDEAQYRRTITNNLFDGSWFKLLIGQAGCGKSTLIKHLEEGGKKILKLAPTNLAASGIKGKTICSWLGISNTNIASLNALAPDKVTRSVLSLMISGEYDAIYIDEVGQLPGYLMAYIHRGVRQANIIQVRNGYKPIVIIGGGDYLQLRAIGESDTDPRKRISPFFEYDEFEEYDVIRLSKVYRQKCSTWIDCLSKVRLGDYRSLFNYLVDNSHGGDTPLTSTTIVEGSVLGPRGITLCGKRDTAMKENDLLALDVANAKGVKLSKFPRKASGDGWGSHILLCEGVRVIADGNENKPSSKRVVKGLYGTVIELSSSYISIEYDNGEYREYSTKEALPLRGGMATTLHSVQGLTIPEGSYVQVNLSGDNMWKTDSMMGALYVAITRSVRASNIIMVMNCLDELREFVRVNKQAIAKNLY